MTSEFWRNSPSEIFNEFNFTVKRDFSASLFYSTKFQMNFICSKRFANHVAVINESE